MNIKKNLCKKTVKWVRVSFALCNLHYQYKNEKIITVNN